MTTAPIRVAGHADVAPMADVLSDAFADDPVMNWIFGDRARTARGLPLMFATFLRTYYVGLDTCYLAGDGATVWAPPGKHDPGPALLRGIPGLLRAFGPRLRRPVLMTTAIERYHPREPHWYLFFLGVRTSAQGGGIGSALLADRLAAIDATGQPAYLENSNPRNLPLYTRHGFQVIREIRAGGGAPPMQAMWRDAR